MFRASIASLLEKILSSKHTDLTPTLLFKSPKLLDSFMIRRTTDWGHSRDKLGVGVVMWALVYFKWLMVNMEKSHADKPKDTQNSKF